MKKLIATVLLAAALVLAPYRVEIELAWAGAPAFPFNSAADAAKLQSGPPNPACENGGVVIPLTDDWNVFLFPNQKALFIHFKDNIPDYVYLTEIDTSTEAGHLKLVDVLTIEKAKERFSGPCKYGDEKQV